MMKSSISIIRLVVCRILTNACSEFKEVPSEDLRNHPFVG